MFTLTEAIAPAGITALVNGAVTWGVVSTKLDWLRADIDRAHRRLDEIGAPASLSTRREER